MNKYHVNFMGVCACLIVLGVFELRYFRTPFILAFIVLTQVYLLRRNYWVYQMRLRWIESHKFQALHYWEHERMLFNYFWVWDAKWFEERVYACEDDR